MFFHPSTISILGQKVRQQSIRQPVKNTIKLLKNIFILKDKVYILNNSQSHLTTVHKLYQTINKRQTQLRAKWINGHKFGFNAPMHWTQAMPEINTVER